MLFRSERKREAEMGKEALGGDLFTQKAKRKARSALWCEKYGAPQLKVVSLSEMSVAFPPPFAMN